MQHITALLVDVLYPRATQPSQHGCASAQFRTQLLHLRCEPRHLEFCLLGILYMRYECASCNPQTDIWTEPSTLSKIILLNVPPRYNPLFLGGYLVLTLNALEVRTCSDIPIQEVYL